MKLTYEQKLERIAELSSDLASLKPIRDELEGLKFEVMEEMIEAKSKRSEVVDGYYVIRAERKSMSITSPRKVVNWIKKQDKLKLEEFLRLDTDKVKLLADEIFKEDGEFLPGVEATSTEYLSIRKEEVK